MSASLGLSTGSPLTSSDWSQVKVLRHIATRDIRTEITTKVSQNFPPSLSPPLPTQRDGDQRQDFSWYWRLGLLHQIPQTSLIFTEASFLKLVNIFVICSECFLLSNLLHYGVTPGCEFVNTTNLQIELPDHPKLQVVLVVQHTDLVQKMKSFGSAETLSRPRREVRGRISTCRS